MCTVTVQHARAKHTISLDEGATVESLKVQVATATGVPAQEQCLMARGKRLLDTDVPTSLPGGRPDDTELFRPRGLLY